MKNNEIQKSETSDSDQDLVNPEPDQAFCWIRIQIFCWIIIRIQARISLQPYWELFKNKIASFFPFLRRQFWSALIRIHRPNWILIQSELSLFFLEKGRIRIRCQIRQVPVQKRNLLGTIKYLLCYLWWPLGQSCRRGWGSWAGGLAASGTPGNPRPGNPPAQLSQCPAAGTLRGWECPSVIFTTAEH
jgi:hypothetical protein